MKRIITSLILIPSFLIAQNDSTFLDLSAYVWLDSITITASRTGFDVKEFMNIAQNDQSLQTAFENLRKIAYTYENDIKFYNNNHQVKASYQSTNVQHLDERCQWMSVLSENSSGNYFDKSGETNYYTAKLYERIFFVRNTPCPEPGAVSAPSNPSRARRILESRIGELKKLIYRAGKKADVPLIGNKTAIFDEKMIEYYDFIIESRTHHKGEEAYVFTARVNPLKNVESPEATVVKYLEIYFRKGDFQVLERNTKLQYNAGVYQFDILMKVNLEKEDGIYIPTAIDYDGYWKVVGKKREDCAFQFRILNG